MNVYQEGPMYSHSDFRTSANVHMRTAALSVKRASVLDLITQGTDIRSKQLKKWTPPNMTMEN